MVYGILAVVIFIVVLWVRETAKAAKDPDVIEASELRIPIHRYRKYKEAWDKILVIYEKYGTDSPKSDKLVFEIVSGLPNMNEWRRYGDKQLKKTSNKFNDLYNEIVSNPDSEKKEDVLIDYESLKEEEDFRLLFDEFKNNINNKNKNEYIISILHRVITLKDVSIRWKDYCCKRSSEVKNKITYPVYFNLQTTNGGVVRGNIVDYLFDGTWFSYKVVFEKEIRFDFNTPPKVTHYLHENEIIDILSSKKKGIISLGKVDMTAILRAKELSKCPEDGDKYK